MKKNIILLSIIASTLSISGCSFFNPEYKKPQVETPLIWNDQDRNVEENKDWDLTKVAWWRDFNDPVLNNLITTALKDNNKIQVALGNVLQANAEINKANYGWLPTASVGGGGFATQAFDINSSTSIPGINLPSSQNSSGALVGIIPSYTINIIRQFKLGEISRLSKKMQVNFKDATRLSIISQTSAAYFSFITAKEQLRLQEIMVKKLELMLHYSIEQHKLGATSPMLTEMIKQQLEIQNGKVASIKNDMVHFQNTLKILMGKNPGKIITSRSLNEINGNIKIPINLPSQVLTKSSRCGYCRV